MPHTCVVRQKKTLAFHGTSIHFQPFSTFESPKSCHINLVSKVTQTACSRTYQTSRCWRLWDFGRSSGRCASSLGGLFPKQKVICLSTIILEKLCYMLIFGGEILIHGGLSIFIYTHTYARSLQMVGSDHILSWTIQSSINNQCSRRGEVRTDFNSDGQRITSSSSSNLGSFFKIQTGENPWGITWIDRKMFLKI